MTIFKKDDGSPIDLAYRSYLYSFGKKGSIGEVNRSTAERATAYDVIKNKFRLYFNNMGKQKTNEQLIQCVAEHAHKYRDIIREQVNSKRKIGDVNSREAKEKSR